MPKAGRKKEKWKQKDTLELFLGATWISTTFPAGCRETPPTVPDPPNLPVSDLPIPDGTDLPVPDVPGSLVPDVPDPHSEAPAASPPGEVPVLVVDMPPSEVPILATNTPPGEVPVPAVDAPSCRLPVPAVDVPGEKIQSKKVIHMEFTLFDF